MRRHAALAAALLLTAAACQRADPDLGRRLAEAEAGLGRCTLEEPGTPAREAQAVFYVDRTPTADSGTVGRYAAMLTCMSPGPAGTAVTLVLPNLSDTLPRPGRYRVQAPGVVPAADSLVSLAWAEAIIPARDGITYRGMGGELVLREEPGGGLLGSYLVAFERAPEAPARGPARLVIGGAFAAPRNRLPLETALPRGGR
ncbi:MAG TPA: hypothetical protein VFR81_20545 [Longimicrobium sp.]|nr:hypothetical protein [Longimicrobium sp.]